MLRTIDLTNPLTHNTPIYPSDPPFVATPHATHARDGYSLHRLSFGTHTGTHLDAPFHFDSRGAKVGDLALGKLVGKVWVVDFEDMNLTARERVDWEALASRLPTQDEVSLRDTILLINTSWSSKYYGDTTYFSHPYLSPLIANHLFALGISVVGVDTPSPDETPRGDGSCEGADGFGFHETFLGNGGVIIENLTNLKELSQAALLKNEVPSRWMVSLAPLKLEGLDGSPIRAFAFCVPYDG